MVWMIGPWDPCEGRGGSWKLVRFSKFLLHWIWEGKLTYGMPSIFPWDEVQFWALPWENPMGKFEKYAFYANFGAFPIILEQNLIFQTILLVIRALCTDVRNYYENLKMIGQLFRNNPNPTSSKVWQNKWSKSSFYFWFVVCHTWIYISVKNIIWPPYFVVKKGTQVLLSYIISSQ